MIALLPQPVRIVVDRAFEIFLRAAKLDPDLLARRRRLAGRQPHLIAQIPGVRARGQMIVGAPRLEQTTPSPNAECRSAPAGLPSTNHCARRRSRKSPRAAPRPITPQTTAPSGPPTNTPKIAGIGLPCVGRRTAVPPLADQHARPRRSRSGSRRSRSNAVTPRLSSCRRYSVVLAVLLVVLLPAHRRRGCARAFCSSARISVRRPSDNAGRGFPAPRSAPRPRPAA